MTLSQEARRVKELGEALARLYGNEDFKLVVLDGYIKEGLIGKGAKLGYGYGWKTDYLLEDLKSISNLQYYFDQVEGEYIALEEEVKENDGI